MYIYIYIFHIYYPHKHGQLPKFWPPLHSPPPVFRWESRQSQRCGKMTCHPCPTGARRGDLGIFR